MQYARPANDISLGGWSGPAWSKINEIVPDDDAGYTEKTGIGTLEIGLSGVDDPGVGTGHIISLRTKQQAGSKGPEKLNCQLYEGGVLIAETGVQTLSRGSYTSFEYTLLEAEANSIGNYNDLRLRFVPDQGDTEIMRLTWAELKVPDVAGEEHSGSGSISGKGSIAGTAKKGGQGSTLISAGGTLLAIGLAGMMGIASIIGKGSVVATGEATVGVEEHSGVAAISGNGILAGIGTKQARGDSAITAKDSISANGEANKVEEYSGIAAITGRGALVGLGTKSAEGIGAISGTGIITVGEEAPIPMATGIQVSREERGLFLISNPDNIILIGKKKPILISKK
ncbi:hypothetical protein ES703_22669 [subsurface metagenome]